MAISLAAAITTTAVRPCPSSSSDSLKLSHFSSLQFPSELRNFRSHHVKSRLRRRPLALIDVWCQFDYVFHPKIETQNFHESRDVASKNQTFSSFDELLEKSSKPVLVDFYATWCGPCQFMVPVLEQVSASLIDKIQVVKIDTEKYPAIADKYQIQALPTFILFKDGKPFDRFEGAMGADQLIERVEASLQVKQ